MDRLTPSKIRLLINLAESSTPQRNTKLTNTSGRTQESDQLGISSDILDINKLNALGDSQDGPAYLGCTWAELGLNDYSAKMAEDSVYFNSEIRKIKEKLDAQSEDVAMLVRESIANSNDLKLPTQSDDSSLRKQETYVLVNSKSTNNTNALEQSRLRDCSVQSEPDSLISEGRYFKQRSSWFGNDQSDLISQNAQVTFNDADSRNFGMQPSFLTVNDSVKSQSWAMESEPVKDDQIIHNVVDLTEEELTNKENKPTLDAELRPPTGIMASKCFKRKGAFNQNSNESSIGDSSLSVSLLAKALNKIELESSPSSLFAHVKQNQPQKPPRKLKNHFPIETTNLNLNESCGKPQNRYPYIGLQDLGDDCDHKNRDSNVMTLRKAGRTDTASSVATIATVIRVPSPDVSISSVQSTSHKHEESFTPRANSTVSENDKIQESKQSVMGRNSTALDATGRTSNMLTPDYKPLDASIIWSEIIPERASTRQNKNWIDFEVQPTKVFIGINTKIDLSLTSNTDKILTCKLLSPENDFVTIQFAKIASILRPNSKEKVSVFVTANEVFSKKIPIQITIQDLCSGEEVQEMGELLLTSVKPDIDVVTSSNMAQDIVQFPAVQRGREVVKLIGLKSDCEGDLRLDLETSEKFFIHSVQIVSLEALQNQLKRTHRVISAPNAMTTHGELKSRARAVLLGDSALAVTLLCNPHTNEAASSLDGKLTIKLMSTDIILKSVQLTAEVGTVRLQCLQEDTKKLLNMEPEKIYTLSLKNTGTVESTWRSNVLEDMLGSPSKLFRVTPAKVTVKPGEIAQLQICYTGNPDTVNKRILILKNIYDGKDVFWEISGGREQKITKFPIRATSKELSWVTNNTTQEIAVKNTSDKSVRFLCQVSGDSFKISTPNRGEVTSCAYQLSSQECVTIQIIYRSARSIPSIGKISLSLADDNNNCKYILLHGCSDKSVVTWCGETLSFDGLPLVTLPALYSRMRGPNPGATLTLAAKGDSPSFVTAVLHYNWRNMNLKDSLSVTPCRAIVQPGTKLKLKIELIKPLKKDMFEGKPVINLATLEVSTGPLSLKKRLLRILEANPKNEELKNQLSRLAGPFEGEEDYTIDLDNFQETIRAVPTLISYVKELSAGITLKPDFGDATLAFDETTQAINFVTLSDTLCNGE